MADYVNERTDETTERVAAMTSLKPILEETYKTQAEAKRRLWRARDRVEKLQRDLTEAEVALIAAQRDFEQEGEWMQMVWSDFRRHAERIPVSDG